MFYLVLTRMVQSTDIIVRLNSKFLDRSIIMIPTVCTVSNTNLKYRESHAHHIET